MCHHLLPVFSNIGDRGPRQGQTECSGGTSAARINAVTKGLLERICDGCRIFKLIADFEIFMKNVTRIIRQ